MNSKVSIITVTYNCKEQLKSTLLSVSEQDYPYAELIIIDGNSTDGTLELIKEKQEQIAFWLSEPDKGIYDAMNKGLKAATGDYVLFLNAGDTFYSSDTLSKIPFEEHNNADVFYGETLITNLQGELLGLRSKRLPHNLSWKHFKEGMVVCHQSFFVRREIASFYNLEYKYSADIDWVIKALKAAKAIVYTHTIISIFETGGFSSQNKWDSWKERWTILKDNFGLVQCIVSHIVFIFESFLVKIRIKPNYRKIDPKLHYDED